MTNIDPKKLSSNGRKLFEKIEFDDKERLYAEIRKHPFGLYLRYASGLFVTLIFSFIFFILPAMSSEVGNFGSVLGFVGFILVVLVILVSVVSAYLYESNVLLITSDKMAQIINVSIFSSKISQLSIGDVQDVTVVQRGFFAKIFNYGTIIVETAGEQSNLNFSFVPEPYDKAKVIVASHEENLKLYGN